MEDLRKQCGNSPGPTYKEKLHDESNPGPEGPSGLHPN